MEFKRGCELVAFGRYSLDTTLRIVNELGLAVFDCLQRKRHPTREQFLPEIDGQDVSSTLFNELSEMEPWLKNVEALRKHQEELGDDSISDTETDPTFHPEDEEEDEDEQTTSAKRPLEEPVSPTSKRTKTTKTTTEESDTVSSTKKRRSHHKKYKCPFCSKELFDLKRHLRMHAKNEEIEEGEVESCCQQYQTSRAPTAREQKRPTSEMVPSGRLFLCDTAFTKTSGQQSPHTIWRLF